MATPRPYQRVGNASVTPSDYDFNPAVWGVWLQFDGSDDWLSTANINFSATDKASVFAGVRKLSDALSGMIIEQNNFPISTTTRSWTLFAPNGNALANYGPGVLADQVGGGVEYCIGRATTYAAPITNVLTTTYNGVGVTYADKVQLRVDAIAKTLDFTNSFGTLTTGKFGNFPLYIGSRSGTTLPFNGRIYSLIVRDALTSSPQLEQTEKWVAGKTGVTL